MQAPSAGAVGDLVTAGEAVGEHQSLAGGCAQGGQQRQLAAGDRGLVVLGREAEGAGEAAAAGVEEGDVEAGAGEEIAIGAHAHDGFVVAVAVEDRLPGERGRLPMRRTLLQQLGEGEDVLP